jgi:hypothetical protein
MTAVDSRFYENTIDHEKGVLEMRKETIIATSVLLALLFAVGCTSYYKVTDLATEEVYYTTEVNPKDSGAVQIKDGKSGAQVVLPSSKVEQITEEEYNQGIY